jgi:hypothetical protein
MGPQLLFYVERHTFQCIMSGGGLLKSLISWLIVKHQVVRRKNCCGLMTIRESFPWIDAVALRILCARTAIDSQFLIGTSRTFFILAQVETSNLTVAKMPAPTALLKKPEELADAANVPLPSQGDNFDYKMRTTY